MKNLIKKILREENDWDWTEDALTDANIYLAWLREHDMYTSQFYNPRMRENRKWERNRAGEISTSLDYLIIDAKELMDSAEEINNYGHGVENRRDSLDTYESYSALGNVIENSKVYLELIANYADIFDMDEQVVVEMWETIHGMK